MSVCKQYKNPYKQLLYTCSSKFHGIIIISAKKTSRKLIINYGHCYEIVNHENEFEAKTDFHEIFGQRKYLELYGITLIFTYSTTEC